MDVDARIMTILHECRWVSDPGTAVQLIPALAAEAPPFVMLPQKGGEPRASVPVLCVPMLAKPVVQTVVSAVAGEAQALEELDAAEVMNDPLVAAIAECFSQSSRSGLRSQTVPILAVTHIAWRVLSGGVASLPGLDEPLLASARTAAARVAAAKGSAATDLYRAITWALKARFAAGLNLAGMAGADVLTGGLYREILTNPLLFAFPRGTLDTDPGLAAELLGLSLDPALVQASQKAGAALVAASRKRLEAGSAEPLDIVLQSLLPANIEPERAALHPVAGPAIIAAMPTLLDAKALKKAGVDARYARGLTSARGARALTAAWTPFCEALGGWDVLSSLVARVVPLRQQDGRTLSPAGVLPVDARWPLLLPRPNAATTVQAVVAVRLTEVRESLIGGLVNRPWSLNNISQAWERVARANGAAVRQVLGDYAVCTFPAPELAVRFALLARKAVGPDAGLELGDDGTTVPIPPTSAVGIGLALGVVDGGTDGERASLSGRGVAEAIALAGNGRAARLHDDGVGVRQAGWGTDGFLNEGIVASETFIRTVLERVRRRNQPVHVRGEGGMCGGISDDFALAPVSGWWEVGDGLVAAALVIDGSSGVGAAEVRVLSSGDFREWHASDKSAAALRRTTEARRSAPAREPQLFAMGGHAGSDSAPAARSTPPDDGHYDGGMDEPSTSFLDGGGATLRASEGASRGAQDGAAFDSGGGDSLGPSDSFGFGGSDGARDSAIGSYSVDSQVPSPEPAPPMMLVDDEPEEAATADEPPRVAAPMIMDEPDEAPPAASDSERPPAPPMMLMDEEDDSPVVSAPMFLDDTHDSDHGGGLLGEVTARDPFEVQEDSVGQGLEKVDSAFGPGKDEDSGNISMLHSTYQGEMELVEVAGFSLQGGETAQGTDPYTDPTEQTGFFDERMSENPRMMDGGTIPQSAPQTNVAGGAMVRELVRLLRGYVVLHDDGSHTFGLPDGGLLRDAYTHQGDLNDAYVGFLQSKVAEGFIPRADRVVALVPGVRPSPIDPTAIEQAAGQAGL